MATSQHLLFLTQTKEEAGATRTGTSTGQCWVEQCDLSSLVGVVVGKESPRPSHLAKVLGMRSGVRGSHITEALDSDPGLMVGQR